MPAPLTVKRIESIDLLKGLVMVIMALDHVRDYFHFSAYYFNPIDPAQSTLPIYFTRWITNFCAPTFCFLAGLSAFMSGRKKTKAALSVFLIKRGVWLILMELTLVTFGWQFDPLFHTNGLAVISALGISMIFLAGLIHLPRQALLVFCVVVIAGHNLLDRVPITHHFWWSLVHQAEIFTYPGGFKFYIDYPFIPWIAVMPLGYWFGTFYEARVDTETRRKLFTTIGLAAIVLFFGLRALNVYGDLHPWTHMATPARTLMSFLNVTKYPPSLLYLLITLGPVLIFLGNTEWLKGGVVSFFTTFGRVPFFYYLIHLYLIHLFAAIAGYLSGMGWKLLAMPEWILELPGMKGYGFSLIVVYLVWMGVIAILYPLCKWYDRYKSNHKKQWWLSYL